MPGRLKRLLRRHACVALAVVPLFLGDAALAAEGSWPELRASLFGDRFLAQSDKVISLNAPYRTANDARTVLTVAMTPPEHQAFSALTLILDENPMPVSAHLAFAEPIGAFEFTATMRINGPTPVHAVVELANGQLFVAEGFVKTSGQGACAAPPGTDPAEALATLGQMELVIKPRTDAASLLRKYGQGGVRDLELEVDIKHPSHSGMQMDQISLLYIPARYVETLDLDVNGVPFVSMTGSISLSENPTVSFSVPAGTKRVRAKLTDTDGTVSETERGLADY